MTAENKKKLTQLFNKPGLKDLRGYVYCGLIEKLYEFSKLNNLCKDAGLPQTTDDDPKERFEDSIKFMIPIWEDLVYRLYNSGGDFTKIKKDVDERINIMRNDLKTYV